jgi:hypothetical protein
MEHLHSFKEIVFSLNLVEIRVWFEYLIDNVNLSVNSNTFIYIYIYIYRVLLWLYYDNFYIMQHTSDLKFPSVLDLGTVLPGQFG